MSVVVRTFRRGTVSEWLVVAFVAPVVLGVVSLAAGFGLGTLCTNVPGNGTLDVAPCNRVSIGVEVNAALQLAVFVLAIGAAWAPRGNRVIALMLTAVSIGGFVATMVFAGSY